MADTVIQFPGIKAELTPQSNAAPTTTEMIDAIVTEKPPSDNTEVYAALQLLTIPSKMKAKTNFSTGGQRNAHWGMVLSFSLIPELSKAPVGPMMLPTSPSQLIVSDSLESIRERVIYEIDKAIRLSQIAEKDPEGYAKYEQALMRRIAPSDDEDGS
jgi:hypothetical protein